MVYLEKGDSLKAAQCYEKALDIDSSFSFAYFNRGSLYLEKREYSKALSDYNRVLELDPENALTYFNRAILKSSTKDYKGAIADYGKAIELNPNNILSYFKSKYGVTKGAIFYQDVATGVNQSKNYEIDFGKAGKYGFLMEVSPDGKQWFPFLEGNYGKG